MSVPNLNQIATLEDVYKVIAECKALALRLDKLESRSTITDRHVLNLDEVKQRTGLSRYTTMKYIKEGKLTGVKQGRGSRVLVTVQSMENWERGNAKAIETPNTSKYIQTQIPTD